MLIFGNGEFAKVMHFHLNCPLTVHRRFMKYDEIAFEEADPQEIVISIGHKHRRAIFDECTERHFTVFGYVSNRAIVNGYVWPGAIVFEGNNVQPFASVGRNTVLWSGNHIGHHSRIGDHCFITSHVCIGGGAEIGDCAFIGMNATVFDHVKIGANCVIAAGAVVDRDIPDNHTLSRKGILVKNEQS